MATQGIAMSPYCTNNASLKTSSHPEGKLDKINDVILENRGKIVHIERNHTRSPRRNTKGLGEFSDC